MNRTAWVDTRGSATTELVLLTPLLVLLALVAVAVGRLVDAQLAVTGTAAQAARAASIARNPTAAIAAARATAAASLSERHITCRSLTTSVDVTKDRPGGTVAVTITCTVDADDLSGLRLTVQRVVHARAVAVIDQYRGMAG